MAGEEKKAQALAAPPPQTFPTPEDEPEEVQEEALEEDPKRKGKAPKVEKDKQGDV